MKFNGTDWEPVGDAGFSASETSYTSLAIGSTGTPYVAYQDGGNDSKATVMKFNGTAWVNVGDAGFSAVGASCTSLAIDSTGTPYVAYRDEDSKATVMKYALASQDEEDEEDEDEDTAPSGGSSSSSNNDANVLINGKPESVGTSSTIKQGDQIVTTMVLDQEKLDQKLAGVGNNAVVTIPISSNADIARGELNGAIVKTMENKQAILELKTDTAVYTIPAGQIDIDKISEQLGKAVELKDIKVQIEITKSQAETVKIVESSAKNGEFTIVASPMEFTVKCTNSGKTVEVGKFNSYVERTITIPDGIDPNKITTGIVIEADGTVRHVPTKITQVSGKYYAKIESLTNSTYSVVYHPLVFKDVENHWAKDAANDMGSRMVINGTGNNNFEPDRDIARAEFAAIVTKALGLKPGEGSKEFKDVDSSDWYSDYVKTAYENKIITGYDTNTFGPQDKITREQAMVMIARAMSMTSLKANLADGETDSLLAGFKDGDDAADYAKGSIAACIKAELVYLKNSSLIASKDNITRAESAQIIKRLLQKSGLI
jgi:hypothetical protein